MADRIDRTRGGDYAEFLVNSAALLKTRSGTAGARESGVEDYLASGDVLTDDAPVFAFLEAQGYEAASSSVLSRFALVDVPEASGAVYGQRLAGSERVTAAGWTPGTPVVVDRPGEGLVIAGKATPVHRPGADHGYLVVLEPGPVEPVMDETRTAELRPAVQTRLLLGAAAETLGACARLIDDAVGYVGVRHQFGSALGDFPAVQDLLAWAAADRHQLTALLDAAIGPPAGSAARARLAPVVKALAGRASRRIAQQTLQVTGGVGFTWEYPHHRLQQRCLELDTVGRPASDLVVELGRAVRLTGELDDLVPL